MNTFTVLVFDPLPGSMNISLAHLPSTDFKRVLPHSLLVGVISALGILTGFVPSLSAPTSMMFSNAAYAQAAVTPEEVQNYARSVLAIEPPDDALIDAMFTRDCSRRGLDARPELIQWLIARVDRSYVALVRAVDALDQEIGQSRKRLSIPLARGTLAPLGLIVDRAVPGNVFTGNDAV